jgi:hypothetical protein
MKKNLELMLSNKHLLNRIKKLMTFSAIKIVNNTLSANLLVNRKNPKLKHLIIEVSPEIRKIILNINKLNIEWSRHSVKDFISVTRCFKCLGFGHSKNNCDSDQQFCSSCGQCGHIHTNCPLKTSNSSIQICVNCKKYNDSVKNPETKKLDHKHNALYSRCPSLLRIKIIISSKINYE